MCFNYARICKKTFFLTQYLYVKRNRDSQIRAMPWLENACSRVVGGGFNWFAVMHQCIGASSRFAISVRRSPDDLSALDWLCIRLIKYISDTASTVCLLRRAFVYACVHVYAIDRISTRSTEGSSIFPYDRFESLLIFRSVRRVASILIRIIYNNPLFFMKKSQIIENFNCPLTQEWSRIKAASRWSILLNNYLIVHNFNLETILKIYAVYCVKSFLKHIVEHVKYWSVCEYLSLNKMPIYDNRRSFLVSITLLNMDIK